MLHAKVIHLLFVISWMACLFYLPRILVHYSEGFKEGQDVRRVLIMGVKLNRFGYLMGVMALGSGSVLWLFFGISGGWLHVKLFLVACLLAYQFFCSREIKRIGNGKSPRKAVFYRLFNESVLVLVLGILYLVVFKPF